MLKHLKIHVSKLLYSIITGMLLTKSIADICQTAVSFATKVKTGKVMAGYRRDLVYRP